MIPAAMAANCAFMLTGTPPNAIVFGNCKVSIGDDAGFGLNVIAALIIIVVVYLWVPVVNGIDLLAFPF